METNDQKKINRRKFFKVLGIGAATTGLLYGCGKRGLSSGTAASIEVPKGKMTYRLSPKGDKVSILGYGCMRLPTVKTGKEKEAIDQDRVNKLFDYAIDHGVNYFDTAPVYMEGFSEKATGIALKRHPRNKFFIATKMSNMNDSSRENSLNLYHQSFKNLQVDYIDYYLLHAIAKSMDILKARFFDNGMLDFLLKEREAGHIRNLGFSYHGDIAVFNYMLATGIKWDFVQIEMNYVDWKHASVTNLNAKSLKNFNAEYLYGELRKRNIPAIIMEPLQGGRLSNIPDHMVARLKQRRPEDSTASWAFRFAGSPKGVLTVLSGMTYLENLQDNIHTYSPLNPVSEDEKNFLEETAQMLVKYPTIPCNYCKYCMPCPYGIDIPSNFKHYNTCVNEGNIPKDRMDKNYSKERQIFLVGYDRSVPRLRQANHCIGCRQCVPHCPQSIQIPDELHKIDKFVEKIKEEVLV